MTEKCRKSLEHKQGAMEEARVKAVLPVPKTTPHSMAAERDGAARSLTLPANTQLACSLILQEIMQERNKVLWL